MRRREFIAGLGVVTAWPFVARSQQAERVRRIGILMPYPPSAMEMQRLVRVFREELRKKGWATGINIQFDERWTADNMDLIRSSAANLVELKSDVIVAVGGRVIPVLMQTTRSVPIVVPGGIDPVGTGYAQSIARPGGNVTGFAVLEPSIIGKMLQLLKELAPSVTRVAAIYNPDNPASRSGARLFQEAAAPLSIEPVVLHIHGLSDFEKAVAGVSAQPNGGLFFPLDVTTNALFESIVPLVARHRLPAIYNERMFVMAGGLAYYGADRVDRYRGAASYVDRILRGEKAGDLPWQQPSKYDLVINRKTANDLGLTVPPKLLFTADEVIE